MHPSQASSVAKLKRKFVPPKFSGTQSGASQPARAVGTPAPAAKNHNKPRLRDSGVGLDDSPVARAVPSREVDNEAMRVEDDAKVIWAVQFRRPQARMHKTWDDDGHIIFNGQHGILRDSDGKELGRGVLKGELVEGTVIKFAGRECLLDSEITAKSYARLFGGGAAVSEAPRPIKAMPAPPKRPVPAPLPPRRQPSVVVATPARPDIPRRVLCDSSTQTHADDSPTVNQRKPDGGKKQKKRLFEPEHEEEEVQNEPPRVKQKLMSKNIIPSVPDDEDSDEDEADQLADDQEVGPLVAKTKSKVTSRTSKSKSKSVEAMPRSPVAKASKVDNSLAVPLSKIKAFKSPAMVPLDANESSPARLAQDDSPDSRPRISAKSKGKGKQVVPASSDEEEEDQDEQMDTEDGTGRKGAVPWPDVRRYSCEVSDRPVASVVQEVQARYFNVLWRNYSAKKTAGWQDDGILVVTGKKLVLLNTETRKEISSGKASTSNYEPDTTLAVGSKLLQIGDEMDLAAFKGESAPVIIVSKPILAKKVYLPIKQSSIFQKPVAAGRSKTPTPRFDPTAAGAIVMPRPPSSSLHNDLYNPKNLPIIDVVLDPIIAHKLRPHQVEGIKSMYQCVMGMKIETQGCILADEMGLGKTAQAIALVWTLLKQSPYFGLTVIQRVMIVCPVTLVKNWAAEFTKWLGRDRITVYAVDGIRNDINAFINGKSYVVLIIGYEKLLTVVDSLKAAQPPIGLMICDEGHKLKSADSKLAKTLGQLPIRRRIILSGTPVQNDLSELHSMTNFVNPGLLETYASFKKLFESVILKGRAPNASKKSIAEGEERSAQLYRITSKYIIRRTADVMAKFLPPKYEYVVFIAPTDLQVRIYKAILAGRAVSALLSGSDRNHLAMFTVMQKLCNSAGLLLADAKRNKTPNILTPELMSLFGDELDPNSFKLSGKLLALATLLDVIDRNKEEKIVIVSNFTSTLDIIQAYCKRKRYAHCRLDGKTANKHRMPMVTGFNAGPLKQNFIFLLSSKSGGTGINLIGASRLVLIDSDWNPSNDLQSMARIHRDGQSRPCYIYRFLTTGTVDEKIYQRQIMKLGLSGSVMEKESKGKGSKGAGDAFNPEQLRNIFQLHTGVVCQTHDLLGCGCHLEGYEKPGDDEEEEEEPEPAASCSQEYSGFQTATQFVPSSPDVPSKDRKSLNSLKGWVHYNSANDDEIAEDAENGIEDILLRTLILTRINEAEDDEDGQAVTDGTRGPEVGLNLKGGHITFVLGKKSQSMDQDAEEEDDAEEDEEED